jgi:hypothetical protein
VADVADVEAVAAAAVVVVVAEVAEVIIAAVIVAVVIVAADIELAVNRNKSPVTFKKSLHVFLQGFYYWRDIMDTWNP